ncbi:MAG: glycosyl hydrolase family 65 protein [Acidimicrobiales bacterium]
MLRHDTPLHLPTPRFDTSDPWRLVETEYDGSDLGLTETLFALGNGYLGMRANPEEGREAHSHGTVLNGFHETWPIQHAENAYGFATTGQTIVNVPDAKVMKIYVDDEPLLLGEADLDHYERVVDFRAGTLTRDLVWRTPSGGRVQIRTQRLISFEYRHLAVASVEITALDASAPIVISSQLLNRQDGEDEYHVRSAALGEGMDPRKSRRFGRRVLVPQIQRHDGDDVVLGYRCAESGMTVSVGYRHLVECDCDVETDTVVSADHAKTVFSIELAQGQTVKLSKIISYHSSRGVPAEELADRCQRTIARAISVGLDTVFDAQRTWLDDFWRRSDIQIDDGGDGSLAADQQAIRWNLWQLAQASARTQEQGIAAKGVTADGYEGHYFWDTEVYVLPFLAVTHPELARKLLRFRWKLLPLARERARTLNQNGALFPWRTINGEEASAYYAAGTAAYHINAAIAFAIERYMDATDDLDFLADEGAEVLTETARLWEDLGFYTTNGSVKFRIHGVTGPDEYTAVVNDNLYTNVMARFNLRFAANTVERLKAERPADYQRLVRKTGLTDDEVVAWNRAADHMFLPFDADLGIHPQDDSFLEREPWDFEDTPDEKYPLLLHFHPLVIYRHQVLKQADVVLAMYLRADHFTDDQKRRNFDYYDPITTGDSSLSACVQAIVAAQIGRDELAYEYFRQALYVDLADTHGNASDGVHIASTAGVWAGVVFGFGGLSFDGDALRFTPNLPEAWSAARFRMMRFGTQIEVELAKDGSCTVTSLEGPSLKVGTATETFELAPGATLTLPATTAD